MPAEKPAGDLELVFVELPKFTKKLSQLKTSADRWLYFLREAPNLKNIPKELQKDPEMKEAFEIARTANLTPEEEALIDRREHDLASLRRLADQNEQFRTENERFRQERDRLAAKLKEHGIDPELGS